MTRVCMLFNRCHATPPPGSTYSICPMTHRDWARWAKVALGQSARCHPCPSAIRWKCSVSGSCWRWPASRCARPTSDKPWLTGSSCRTWASEDTGPLPLQPATTIKSPKLTSSFLFLSAVVTKWLETRYYITNARTMDYFLYQ